jgi:hypothetical protein
MKRPARVWAITAGLLALGVWAAVGVNTNAADKKSGAIGDIDRLSDAIEKGEKADVTKIAKEIGEKYEELDKIMHLFKTRKKKGLGVGAKAGAVSPDGIELKLLDLSKKEVNGAQLSKQGKALEKMGYHIASIAHIALVKAPPNDCGPKKVKDWNGWAEDLKTGGLDLAKSAKAKDADGANKAVSKINASCANCHEKFRKNN